MAGLKQDDAGTLASSINENLPDFQAVLALTDATLNMTSGINQGIGPRYGMAPIPGQSDNETPGANQCPGIMRANLTGFGLSGDTNTWTLVKVFAIYPIRIGGGPSGSSLSTINTYYIAVIGYNTNLQAGLFLDTVLLSTVPGSNSFQQSANIYAGLSSTGADSLNFAYTNGGSAELTQTATLSNKASIVLNLTKLPTTSTNFVSSTLFSVPGVENPMKWLVGMSVATGGASNPGVISLYQVLLAAPGNCFSAAGIPPSFNRQNFPLTPRAVTEWAMKVNGDYNNIGWNITATVSTTNYAPLNNDYDPTTAVQNINFFSAHTTVSKFGSGSTYSDNAVYLFSDPAITCNSAYQGTLVATGAGGFAVLIQDWYQNVHGLLPQYVDLTSNPMYPPNFNATYTEDGGPVPNCFYAWPIFVRGTALSPQNGVALGAANSGILRANTTYEFTYSVFNKRLNFETNVGSPVKIQTSTNDFIGLQLFTSTFAGGGTILNPAALRNTGDQGILPWPGASSFTGVQNVFHINDLEYRFYYRPEGAQSWLPALFVDAPKFWFYPDWTPMMACTGAIGGLPGGMPGGFQDYSPLPADTYDCVVMYKNRAFWFSPKSVCFSLINNIFAYAGRNTASCPTGSFRGALVQAYYGQAQQDARLVVFGTDATYVGKFTGIQQQVPVTVSAAAGPINFALDGSDFVLNTWTSITAFSYRSAVVAEGILYFWGPQGVFKDDGVNPLIRISVPIEPQLFGLYDPSATAAISCTYNQTTKEIYWFYNSTASTVSQVLTWNTAHNTWIFGQMRGQVDAAQQLKVDTGIPTAGSRTMLICRTSKSGSDQRVAYFDQNNLAADMFPGQEILIKTVATPSAGVRRFTIAAGDLALSNIHVGDVIAVQQCAAYTNGALATPSDFIAAVAAVNTGARTIDVTLPTGATMDTSATIASNAQYFPIWHAAGTNGVITGNGINAFPYVWDTKFWVPNGMSYWAYWLYVHLVYKLYDLLPIATPLTQGLTYQTPVSVVSQTDTLTLKNNSANNCQILHSLIPGEQAFEGQGIKFTLSGIQLASSWILQFLQTFSQPKDGLQLKDFEG